MAASSSRQCATSQLLSSSASSAIEGLGRPGTAQAGRGRDEREEEVILIVSFDRRTLGGPARMRRAAVTVAHSFGRPSSGRSASCVCLPLAPGHDTLPDLPRYQIGRANGCVILFPMLPATCGHFVVEILMRGRRQLRARFGVARVLFFGCVFIRRYPVPAIFSSLGYRTSAGPATTIKTPSLSCLRDRRADLPGAAFQMDGQSNELSDAPS